MIELIKKALVAKKDVEWVISETKVSSYELFFVKRGLQMNRTKDVTHYSVDLYLNDSGLKGSANISIHPTMNEKEVIKAIDDGIYAASFAKNQDFKLATPTKLDEFKHVSNMAGKKLSDVAIEIADAIFKEDKEKDGILNATEIFVNKEDVRVVNSNGVDYENHTTNGQVEYITTWCGKQEEVELYRFLEFSDLDPVAIANDVKNQLLNAKYRSLALPMKNFKNVNVVFNVNDIMEMLTYYISRTEVTSVFSKSSDWKEGSNVQNFGTGDKLNITIDPLQEGSTNIRSFDLSGYPNEKVQIIKDGVVTALWGSRQFAQYLGYDSKVNNRNIEVGCGSLTNEELESEPYLELVSLSGLQVDNVTGSFGSEIRLALYHENGKITPYYGGSITGFMKQYDATWKFSKEKVHVNHYHGPKYLEIKGVNILGKE